MNEKKDDKKKVTPWDDAPDSLKKMITQGMPTREAHFLHSVNNSDNEPETNFCDKSGNRGRRVDMIWTPYGLLCHHKGKYFTVPLSLVRFANFIPRPEPEEPVKNAL